MAETTQTQQSQQLIVRPARPEDRAAVLAFCARTWGNDGDYIPYVWDRWLGDTHGVLLVALAGERPVGIVHMRMMSGDEAWIEGIRVDPAERRQGVGRVLTSRALAAAHERGATVARLFTDHDNLASQGLVAHFGFTRVAEVVRHEAPALELTETLEDAAPALGSGQASPPLDPPITAEAELEEVVPQEAELMTPGEADFERIWAWLVQSNLAPFNGGLEFGWWKARALTEPSLREALIERRVWLLEAWETILALAITGDMSRATNATDATDATDTAGGQRAALHVRYMDGSSEGVGRLALVLREIAAEHGLARVELWLPNLLILSDAMDGAGYTHGDLMYVYARDL